MNITRETLAGVSAQATVLERLIRLVRQTLDKQATCRPLPIDARLSEIGVSSMNMVSLMLMIEADFNLTIPQEEITPENFHSIASIASMLEKITASI